jgi:hypothetical protein
MYQRSNTSDQKMMTSVETGCSREGGVSEADVFAKILQQMLEACASKSSQAQSL